MGKQVVIPETGVLQSRTRQIVLSAAATAKSNHESALGLRRAGDDSSVLKGVKGRAKKSSNVRTISVNRLGEPGFSGTRF